MPLDVFLIYLLLGSAGVVALAVAAMLLLALAGTVVLMFLIPQLWDVDEEQYERSTPPEKDPR